MQTLTLQTAPDALERLTRKPFEGICELIWNAVDADAKRVQILIESSPLGGITKLIVADDGHGMDHTAAVEAFGHYGGSRKKARVHSPDGRLYHGRSGRGRYRAIGLGRAASWRFVYDDQLGGAWGFTTYIEEGNLNKPTISRAVEVMERSGCSVEILDVSREANSLLNSELPDRLLGVFASYLLSHPEVVLEINGVPLDAKSQVEQETTLQLSFGDDPFELLIVFWLGGSRNELNVCRSDGMPIFYERGPKGAGSPYSAFLKSEIFDSRAEEDAELGSLDQRAENLKRAARVAIQVELRKRAAVKAQQTVDQLQEEGIYPYKGDPKDEREVAERSIFAVAAEVVHALSPSLSGASETERRLKMQLLAAVVDEQPSARERIVQKVFALDDESTRIFAELLDRVPLANIVSLASTIVGRLDFLDALHHLVYNTEARKALRERTQLHKILEQHCWIFGEGFAIGQSDASLRNILREHLSILGRDEIAPTVDVSDLSMQRIPDLMLFRQTPGSAETLDHLIVELKRPSVDLGRKEFDQILDYADAVANHPGFDKDKVKWRFVLVSSDVVEKDYRQRASSGDREPGVLAVGRNFTVRAHTWGQIIHDARMRMNFMKQRLNYHPEDHQHAIEMLRRSVPEYLPDFMKEPSKKE